MQNHRLTKLKGSGLDLSLLRLNKHVMFLELGLLLCDLFLQIKMILA